MSGEGWRLPLPTAANSESREREILFATSPAFFDTVCISSCWNIANFYCQSCQRMAFMHNSAFILCNFIEARVQETHQEYCNALKQSQQFQTLGPAGYFFLVLVNLPSFESSNNKRWLAVRQQTNWGNGATKLSNYSHSNPMLLPSRVQIFSLQHYKIF